MVHCSVHIESIMDSTSISTVGKNIPQSYKCNGLPNSGTIVSDIKDEVTEAMVCKYFGPKSSKSGWKYMTWTTPSQQDAILSLYQRVYEVDDVLNKEISLSFAKGLILMSRGEEVNWKQFSDVRRGYRESLKKNKMDNKQLKREGDGGDSKGPTRVGKKRCVASEGGFFPESLQLTMKPEYAEGVVMGGKGSKYRLKAGPNWGKEEVESMVSVIEKSTTFMTESKVQLSSSQLELSLFEDKLRRARILLSDRRMMSDESSEEVRKYCEVLSSLRSTIIKKKKILVEVEKAPPNSEQCSQLAKEILSDESTCERILVQKDMEGRIVSRSQKALLSCQLEVDGLHAQLEKSVQQNAKVTHRVLAMEKLLVGMKDQLIRMQDGGGASFFPRPVFGSPLTPVVAIHTLNACPVCSLWFSAYDYVSLGCGHTYHPFCLFYHSQSSSNCLLETCGVPFHLHSIAGIGIRVEVEAKGTVQKKAKSLETDVPIILEPSNVSDLDNVLESLEGDQGGVMEGKHEGIGGLGASHHKQIDQEANEEPDAFRLLQMLPTDDGPKEEQKKKKSSLGEKEKTSKEEETTSDLGSEVMTTMSKCVTRRSFPRENEARVSLSTNIEATHMSTQVKSTAGLTNVAVNTVSATEPRNGRSTCESCKVKPAVLFTKGCTHEKFCFACIQGLQHCPICEELITGWDRISSKAPLNPPITTLNSPDRHTIIEPIVEKGGIYVQEDISHWCGNEHNVDEDSYNHDSDEDIGIHWSSSDVFENGGLCSIAIKDPISRERTLNDVLGRALPGTSIETPINSIKLVKGKRGRAKKIKK